MDSSKLQAGEEEAPIEASAAAKTADNLANKNVSKTAPAIPSDWILNIDVTSKSSDPLKLIFQADQETAPIAFSDDPNVVASVNTTPLPSTSHDSDKNRDKNDGPHDISPVNEEICQGIKRRRCNSSDDESNELLPPSKSVKMDGNDKNKKRHNVTFVINPPLQNDNLENEAPAQQPAEGHNAAPDEVASTSSAPTASKPRVQILPAAEPMWLAARRHRGAEQKAKLRADFNANLLAQDIVPGQFLGAERLPRYYIRDGKLPASLKDLIIDQGKQKTQHAIDILRDEQAREKRLADYYEGIAKDLYKQDDCSYTEADNLMASLLTHYRGIERKRLDALANKEIAKKATNDVDLANMLCREQDKYTIPSTSKASAPRRPRQGRTPSPGRKRKSSTQVNAGKGKQGKPESKPFANPRAKSPKPKGKTSTKKGKSTSNPSKGKDTAAPKKGNKSPGGELSEGALKMLEALSEIEKIFKK